ncbi:MAG: hypothetical protein AW09_003876 [Candidatus Accumulibacter phosphatis]|uniref:Uncharacterized protein n=1 Tax=Candidatus Accumulibacter phosphatis TaxID=327160 RepID=A0A080LRW7_9PROT|nr:MAG: hypothetical protein AW09_003876 [Candidatus Accumulibacter phosphatis]
MMVTLRPFEGVFEADVQQAAVGQLRQGVVVGNIFGVCLGVAQAADVGEYPDVAFDLPVLVVHRGDRQPLRVGFTGLAAVAEFSLPEAGAGQFAPDRVVEHRVMVARLEDAGILADGFLAAVTGDFRKGVIDGDDAGAGVGDRHAVTRQFEHLRRLPQ